ncbi:hypothetical protein ACHHYP_04628 [Achlya hypogyna]|uniref:DUF7726 domain-containing protein n=1 Tax=Achlya hypogyna TaxID=1202772 RepID=A0A1V9ZP57_ACHHY|nr:hypothetical protein ACHHYP_04628 [Achlya hypogyna]
MSTKEDILRPWAAPAASSAAEEAKVSVDSILEEVRKIREEKAAKRHEERIAKRKAKKKAEEEAEENGEPGAKKAKASLAKTKSAERLAEIEAVKLPEGLKVYDDCDDAALADHLDFSVGSIRKYLAMKGKRQGSGSIVYKNAYYFFEKLRILESKAKSKKRVKFEESTPEGYELVRDPTHGWFFVGKKR